MENEEKIVNEAQEGATKEPAVESAPAAEPAAEPAAPKSRDLFFERIRTNFPDGKYDEDEEEYYRNAMTGMDALEKDSKSLKELTEKLNARLGQDPEEAEIVLDWLDGADIRTAITRHKGAEALVAPEEGSEEYDNWKKAGDERKEELAKMKAQLDEYRANSDASAAALKEFAQESGLSDEQAAELEDFIANQLLPDIYAGKLSKDTYAMIQHARNYDADVAGAREQGRIDGRNEKIELEKKHLKGSGLPNGAAGGNASEEVDNPKSNKTADWLEKMSRRRV